MPEAEKKYFYTAEEMADLQIAARFYKLDAKVFLTMPPEFLVKVCNGIGSERFSKIKREAMTLAFKRYEVCAAIHDLDYFLQVGQKKADKRLYDNMLKVWKKDFGIFRFFRPSARVEKRVIIPAFYLAVSIAGSSAYTEAGEEKKEMEEKNSGWLDK